MSVRVPSEAPQESGADCRRRARASGGAGLRWPLTRQATGYGEVSPYGMNTYARRWRAPRALRQMTKGRNTALCFTLIALLASPLRAEIIDRILAVVEGQLITLSDVRAVVRLGLEIAPPASDATQVVLDKLIDRQLMLIEVDRYAPPEPSTAEVDAQLQTVQKPYSDALAFEIVLGQVGWARDDARRYVRDELRIERYLQQRFTATIQPSDDELAAYYRVHANEYSRGGAPVPYAEVREEVRNRFVSERRAALVREWLSGLRRRANISQLYFGQTAPAGRL